MIEDAPAASFTGVWTALVLIVLAVVGTVIMRRVTMLWSPNLLHSFMLNKRVYCIILNSIKRQWPLDSCSELCS